MTTYLSDSNQDYKILEKYLASGAFGPLEDEKAHAGHRNPELMSQTFAAVQKAMPYLFKKKRGIAFPPTLPLVIPTKYDSPLAYQILGGLVEQIKKSALDVGLDTSDFPHYSSIPTRKVNACAVNLPGATKSFLLFDSQIFMYCHLFSKTLARSLPLVSQGKMVSVTTDIEKVRNHVFKNPDVIHKLDEVLAAFDKTGSPSAAKQFVLEKHHLPLSQLLREGMELFIVGHEFGHIYAGHIRNFLAGTKLQAFSENLDNPAHRQEHEADFLGLVLTLKSLNAKGYAPALAYVGVDMLFSSLDMADRYSHVLAHGNSASFVAPEAASHPSNLTRRRVLRELLGEVIADSNAANTALELAKNYETVVEFLWQELEKSLLAEFNKLRATPGTLT